MAQKIWEFKSEDRFQIVGRGTVFTATPTEKMPFNEVYGQQISVDGVLYMCRGIERFAICRNGDDSLRVGERIGLLVSIVKGTYV
jgi:hypothetical protein